MKVIKGIKNQPGLVLLGMVGLLNGIALASFDDGSNADRRDVISCGPNVPTGASRLLARELADKDFNNDHQLMNNSQPAERNNGNGCSHQLAGSSLCDITGSKRRILKMLTC